MDIKKRELIKQTVKKELDHAQREGMRDSMEALLSKQTLNRAQVSMTLGKLAKED